MCLVGYALDEFSKGGDGVWWWVKMMRCDLCWHPEEMGTINNNNMVIATKTCFFHDIRNMYKTKMTRLSGTHIAYINDSFS